jgi:endonuclease/exonuclease/phosphatase (EEP) superfamily protein YafD
MATGHTIRRGATVVGIALLVLCLLPYLYASWWVFELSSHFLPHLGIAAAALAIAALVCRYWLAFASALAAAAVAWAIVLSVPQAQQVESPDTVVLSQNLFYANTRFRQAVSAFTEQDPDIIVLQEYTPEWHDALAVLTDRYAYSVTEPKEGAFGIAVFSREPVRSHAIRRFGASRTPFIHVEFESPGLHLIAVHFQPPTTGNRAIDRNRQLVELAHYLGAIAEPFVIVGDFNNTPYSPVLRSFMRETGAGIAGRIGRPSWPAALGWFGIPIDLAIGSAGVRLGSMSAIPTVGSDHHGLRFALSGGKQGP